MLAADLAAKVPNLASEFQTLEFSSNRIIGRCMHHVNGVVLKKG